MPVNGKQMKRNRVSIRHSALLWLQIELVELISYVFVSNPVQYRTAQESVVAFYGFLNVGL